MIAAYQNSRIDAGRAPKTVNGEVSVLRQVLRHAKLWYRLEDDYRVLKNMKPPVGQAITDEEQEKLFDLAKVNPAWQFAYVAATLAFYCGLRACEIKGLQWKHVDFFERTPPNSPVEDTRRLERPESQQAVCGGVAGIVVSGKGHRVC